jgi:hypothetical protein
MSHAFEPAFIDSLRARLDQHPVYAALTDLRDLRVFMQHHAYSVWDFMSLVKYLQNEIAPARWPWTPGADPAAQRFINELVLGEESDSAGAAGGTGAFASHYGLYLEAMREVGADTQTVARYVEIAGRQGIEAALASGLAPPPAARFNQTTFGVLGRGRPHEVAAALALGREHVIPTMFRACLDRMAIGAAQAPTFHDYLRRHIELDSDVHGPLSLHLLDSLCAGDPARIAQARSAAQAAVQARVDFWDEVLTALPSQAGAAARAQARAAQAA